MSEHRPHCFSCKHWVPPKPVRYNQLYPLAGQCMNVKVTAGDERQRVYQDSPEFFTGSEYGCVLHEARP